MCYPNGPNPHPRLHVLFLGPPSLGERGQLRGGQGAAVCGGRPLPVRVWALVAGEATPVGGLAMPGAADPRAESERSKDFTPPWRPR